MSWKSAMYWAVLWSRIDKQKRRVVGYRVYRVGGFGWAYRVTKP